MSRKEDTPPLLTVKGFRNSITESPGVPVQRLILHARLRDPEISEPNTLNLQVLDKRDSGTYGTESHLGGDHVLGRYRMAIHRNRSDCPSAKDNA